MKPLTAEEIAELRKIVRVGYSHTLEERVLHVDADVRRKCEVAVLKAAPRLLDEVERSRALLKRIEREGWATGTEGLCPACLGHGTHNPDCELAALVNQR